ncbi:hypothetical protein Bca4012_002664 [Brassica carinata]
MSNISVTIYYDLVFIIDFLIAPKKNDETKHFRLLNGVKPLRNNWLIRVKVLHAWKQNTSFGGDTFECVLSDETGVKIATYCKRNQFFLSPA